MTHCISTDSTGNLLEVAFSGRIPQIIRLLCRQAGADGYVVIADLVPLPEEGGPLCSTPAL